MIHKDFEVEIEANIFDVKYELGFEEFPTLNCEHRHSEELTCGFQKMGFCGEQSEATEFDGAIHAMPGRRTLQARGTLADCLCD